jgi:ornithine cyclodeaminase
VLYLNEKDIKELVELKEIIQIIEGTLDIYERKEFVMPDRIVINNNDELYAYMPCFTRDSKGTKILTLFHDNIEKGLPILQGVMLLNNTKTGKIDCILDGAAVTALRTGAVGAVGIKYTTEQEHRSVGVVGAGVQGFYQCIYAAIVRNIRKINIFDINKNKATDLKRLLEKHLNNAEIKICIDTKELVKESEIIITTTTATNPVIPDNKALLKNKHFIGIGSYKPDMMEYPRSLFELLNEVYIDVDYAKKESGDLVIPIREGWISESMIKTLGSAIKSNNVNNTGTTFYKSVGMALFDLRVADYIFNKAIEKNIGQKLTE